MRERLFRGKKKADGTWVTGFYWNDGIKFHYIRTVEIVTQPERKNEYSSIKDFNVYPETVSEYTGLTDKHGRKIFEGEIVETNEKYCPKGYVAYRDDMARFVIIDVWKEPKHLWRRKQIHDVGAPWLGSYAGRCKRQILS